MIALSRKTGAIVWQEQLAAGTNSSVAVDGEMLITAASFPQGQGQTPEIVADSLNAPAGGGEDSGAACLHPYLLVEWRQCAGERQLGPGGEFFGLSTKSAAKPGTMTFVFTTSGTCFTTSRSTASKRP